MLTGSRICAISEVNPLNIEGHESPFYFCANIMKKESWSLVLRVMANLSIWIAAPVIIGSILGEWLDEKFNTKPWLLLATIGVAFIVSMYGLVLNAQKEFKKIDEDFDKDKNNLEKK